MQKLNKIFLTLFVVVITVSVQAANITGTITNAIGKKLYLERFELNKPVKIDSAIISKKGKFTFALKDTTTDFYRISFVETDFIVLILNKTDKADLVADGFNLNKSYKVTGSEHSEKLVLFVNLVNTYIRVKDSISTLITKNNTGQNNDLVNKLNTELNQKYVKFIQDRNKFIDDNPASPALVAVTNHLNLQGDAKGELVYLKKIDAALEKSIKNSFYHKSIHDMTVSVEEQIKTDEKRKEAEANKTKLLEPGREISDFKLKDKDGKIIALSSLRGNYVLIDYWASWCGPCRKENPNVVKMYNKYKDSGFTIYSISLDNSKDKWIDAIAKDGLVWNNHVSELTGWSCSALSEFGVTGIPFTALIDKEGKLIQTNLRGPALEAKLLEILDSNEKNICRFISILRINCEFTKGNLACGILATRSKI